MDGAAGVLVVILAITLAVFLVLSIVLMVLLIRVTQQIKHITESAERTVTQMEDATRNISRVTTPLAVLGALRKATKRKK